MIILALIIVLHPEDIKKQSSRLKLKITLKNDLNKFKLINTLKEI